MKQTRDFRHCSATIKRLIVGSAQSVMLDSLLSSGRNTLNTQTARRCALIVLGLGILRVASADENFDTVVKASAEDALASVACEQAFVQAEDEALDQIDEHFESSAFKATLIGQKETRTLRDNDQTVCIFEGTWRGSPLASASDLVGTEQFIEGQYKGSCLDEGYGDLCWQRVVSQARSDLFNTLENDLVGVETIDLIYVDFEGRQRDDYREKRLEITADGRFFFDVVDVASKPPETSMEIRRDYEEAPNPVSPEPATVVEKPKESDRKDAIDVTLFYTWDGNDSAEEDYLAVSSDRFGVGIWANNRIGFAAFSGEDTLGIAASNNDVKNASNKYDTFGVGLGVRLWNTRGITLENMLYYVDARPYQANIAPNCSSCTPRDFEADDYVQATVNLKTNSNGVNFGWMFTWKFLESELNYDQLSSGLYLEVQF